jgi:hypothetical protein
MLAKQLAAVDLREQRAIMERIHNLDALAARRIAAGVNGGRSQQKVAREIHANDP